MRAPAPSLPTLRDRLSWTYANLARAHRALEDGATRYATVHHVIRARLFAGLRDGTMSMRTLYDDERLKMTLPQCCVYCGSTANLSLDHLMPRLKGGADAADNLVYACRRCNSAKGARDLFAWFAQRGGFPSIFVTRRYLKLAARWAAHEGVLDREMTEIASLAMPFEAVALPLSFPPLATLKLWITPDVGAMPSPEA